MKKKVMTGAYVKCVNDNKEFINFNFYTNLRASEKVKFVNTVTNTLIGSSYDSILRDMIFDFQIICSFTDVDVSEIMENDTINRIEDLLEETNIVDIVKANAEEGLINELNKAIDLNIEYRTGIHRNDLNNALTGLINTIEKKLNSVDTDSLMEVAGKLSGITGDITPERIVEAYAKTDAFKNHLKEVDDKKQKTAEIATSISQALKKR